jgi:predicted transcriptional regulator
MRNVATSVRIPEHANSILSGLATKLGQSKAQVVEIALRELEERIFWADVRDAFERAAADPEEAARQKGEIAVWERVSETDFRDEQW